MKRAIIILFLVIPVICQAQKKKNKRKFLSDTALVAKNEEEDKPDLTLKDETEEEETVALKVKKNVFFGVRTRRSYTTNRSKGEVIIEDFYLLREPALPNQYVQEIYIHDRSRNKVRPIKPNGKAVENLLHGPYKKLKNDIIIEEGMYFYGVRHQRWLYLDAKEILKHKEHYHKGWFRDSDISYYDLKEKRKIKEVVPIQYGKKEGAYYYFFENGRMAVRGSYHFDKKVGIWEEYYNAGKRIIKREVQYPKNAFDKETQPYIRKEWDERGNLVYQSPKIRRTS